MGGKLAPMSHILECEDLLVCLKHHKTNVFARNSKSSFLICSLSKVTGPIGIITVHLQLLILAPSTTIWIKAGGVLVNNPAIKDKIETTNFNLQFVRTVCIDLRHKAVMHLFLPLLCCSYISTNAVFAETTWWASLLNQWSISRRGPRGQPTLFWVKES